MKEALSSECEHVNVFVDNDELERGILVTENAMVNKTNHKKRMIIRIKFFLGTFAGCFERTGYGMGRC